MPNSQNLNNSSIGNKYLRKIKINLRTKVKNLRFNLFVRYSATFRTELNERDFVRQIVDRSWKLTKNLKF